ncbi:[acyl-carrier-protein] S-malonyltransferase [Rudaeicoccus suwonensis]|uniref:[acyl-carrier-protein] S-malonyltransferase n=1 Tax=Rudaeicoccus suwonensis TaxID=657409 RepID=A0A561E9X2_9MICO|nr:[acyl-carrier-protein] S-malonyltransferase [Rudaeicoccus suwonensis]
MHESGPVLAIVCPGQGSQKPGFLASWLELPGVRDQLTWLSATAGIDLVAHGTTSDADTIKDTAVAQPLLVAAGLVTLPAVVGHDTALSGVVGVTAGHSVGEITASAAAGVISGEQAMVFVRERGRLMARASAVTPTGMTAVLGGEVDDVLHTLASHGLTPANINGAGQIVAAGTLDQLAALKDAPPAKAKVIPLAVAGAFHTQHMASATDTLAGYARAIGTHDPRIRLLSNKDGAEVTDGTEVLRRLVTQVSSPVRWDLTMKTMRQLGVTGLIELPPAGTLAGLAKRELRGVEILALKSPDDLDAAARMIRDHAAPATTDDTTAGA